MSAKSKSIDLGALQDSYVQARRAFEQDSKHAEKALDAQTRSKAAFESAKDALAQASRTVLS